MDTQRATLPQQAGHCPFLREENRLLVSVFGLSAQIILNVDERTPVVFAQQPSADRKRKIASLLYHLKKKS